MKETYCTVADLRIVGGTLYRPVAVVDVDLDVEATVEGEDPIDEDEELDIRDLSLEELIALAKDVAEAIDEKEDEMKQTLFDLLKDGIVTITWTDERTRQTWKTVATRHPEVVKRVGGIPENIPVTSIWVWNCIKGRPEAIPFISIREITVNESKLGE